MKTQEKEKVSIAKCHSYEQEEVDKAVKEALNLIGFKFKKGMKVLIKPNIIGSFPKNQIAATTNPSVVEAICKILKKNKCKIFIGDSPFTNEEQAIKASGIDKVAEKYGTLVIFEQDKLVKIRDKDAKVLKEFEIAKTIKNVDLVIDVPKLKTHTLTKYTGAIKNLYGCIPGGMKQTLHGKARGEKKFSKLLVDIYQNILPELSIMDAVVGMEGDGPTSGTSKHVGFILASKNAVALDIAASKMIGYKPKKIYAIEEAIKRKLYPNYAVKILGVNKFPEINFKKPRNILRRGVQKLMDKIFKEKPIIVDKAKCTRCATCAKHCPMHAITLNPYPEVNKKKCIRCFCCMEICPQHALSLKN